MNYDFLVVGQGLAGSVLSLTLERAGYKVAVVDRPLPGGASRAAAGLFNPITGKLFRLSWEAPALFPALDTFYRWAEGLLKARFYYPTPVYRPFATQAQQNDVAGRATNTRWQPFVAEAVSTGFSSFVEAPYGGVLTRQSGFVDVPALLAATRRYFAARGQFYEGLFDHARLQLGEAVRYEGLSARRVVFCEGFRVRENPLFRWLPVVPNKGEILNIETDTDTPSVVFNRGAWAVPTGARQRRVGATFGVHQTDDAPTEVGRQDIEARLKAFFRPAYRVTGQVAGVRPTTPDRRPLVGTHPAYPLADVFNGTGAKGVSLLPFLADQYLAWRAEDTALRPDINIYRYLSFYEKSS